MSRKKGIDSRFLGSCPICSEKFNASRALLLDRLEDMQTLYIQCRHCFSSVVIGVSKNIPGVVTTVGMLTDMTSGDISRLGRLQPLSADDVLEMHKYLEKH